MSHASFASPLPPSATGALTTLRWAELAEQVCRAGRVLGANFTQHAAPHGLSEAQISLLLACGRQQQAGLSQSELAAAMQISPAHVSGLVEQLRGQGWLAGERRAPDRRKQVWQLTSQGGVQLAELIAGLTAWAERLQLQLGSQRCEQLSRLLTELTAVAQQEESPGGLGLYAPPAATIQEGGKS